ncbi:hypothetical protein XENOCAPTIV_008294 [Xenoophorus captivus]|uniref:tRNA (guanine(26)-N(2))-dimethyltransferase n=1 Tax=Xenoophorus captivus TaxID=1517983 RepID=A0ABV0RJL8_9TELE
MVSHLKRHVNKGETEASYSGSSDVQFEEPTPSGQAYEILKELGTNVQLLPNHTTPQKSDTYFNRKMKTNRQLVFCSIAVLAEERNPLECLDAFGATGIMGLQWAKHLRNSVRVTITDISDICVKMIKENCELNNIRVDGGSRGPRAPEKAGSEAETAPIATLEVAKMDANVIMHLRSFDYINVRNLGIISVTSTDTSSLYAKSPNVTLRHYGCHIVRTEYYKELAARMVVASVARSGPLFNTGFLRRMLSAAVQHNMDDIQPLVKTLICESECTTLKSLVHGSSALTNQGKRKSGEESGNVVKKLKPEVSLEHPPFYYSIHRHSIRGMNMPKLNKFLQYLTEAGFRVSRTHFDPTGVRTNATLQQFKSVLTKYSVPTCTNAGASAQMSVSAEKPV